MKKRPIARLLAIYLCLALLAGALASCGGGAAPDAESEPESTAESNAAETPPEDVTPEETPETPADPEVTEGDPSDGSNVPDEPTPPVTDGDPPEASSEPVGTEEEPSEITTERTPETTEKTPGITTERDPETTEKAPSTTEPTSATTEKPDPTPEPTAVPPASGTLLYREDFEGLGTLSSNGTVMSALGWEILDKADGAYTDSTARYAIVSEGGNSLLRITNYENGMTASDSYVQILPDKVLRYLNGQSYTYQYDLTYGDASDDQRYIVLVSSYAEGFYNSAHVRNGGKAHNECHSGSSWKAYAASKNVRSLLGVSSLKGVTLTVRYVVDWENGCKVYARRADSAGAWILLSEFDASQSGASLFDPSVGGAGFVLKVGGAQNGTVDNIMLWSGTMESPNDKNQTPYLSPDDTCHRMVTESGTLLCVLCGRTKTQIDTAWLLTDVPAYDGGMPSRELYLAGQGLDPAQPLSKEDRMQVIADTTDAEFTAYLKKLAAAGFTKEFERTADGNRFASYVKGTQRVYTYFTASYREARVITESTTVSVSVEAFDYTYTKKAGDSTAIYQYALPLRDATHSKSQNYVDRGMLYVVKLADNKVVIFDGGESVQFTEAQIDNFMDFLREITGAGENGRVTIAAWYLTHAHQDHVQGFCFLARKYSSYRTLERVFYNIPSAHSPNATVKDVNDSIVYKMLRYIDKYFADDNVQFLKVHTGQEIRLADVTFEILYTHEDLVDPDTASTELADNYNEASSVVKITFDGRSALITGDIDTKAATILMRQWEAETLKVDILQVAHHVLNVLTDLYHLIQAPILFVPQSEDRINEHSTAPKTFAAAKPYAKDGMIFFQNEQTVGLAVVNGAFEVIYTRDIVYESRAYTWPEA